MRLTTYATSVFLLLAQAGIAQSTGAASISGHILSQSGRGLVVSTAFGAQQSVLPYVDGSSIPPTTVVNWLSPMYTGATSNLLVGIAFRESTCSQFLWNVNPTYSLWGYWPNENYNGTFIGLMMVPPTMSTLFDWTANASKGLSVLQYFLNYAAQYGTQKTQTYPGLPTLTSVQKENEALWWYAGYGGNGNYNLPNSTYTGWVVTTASNSGLQYVQNVRTSAAAGNCTQ